MPGVRELAELETVAAGDAGNLVAALEDAASELDIEVRLVDAEEWIHGQAEGICKPRGADERPVVEVRDRENEADLAVTLVHELAHALLHGAISDPLARSEQELEAEAVAYIVGRHYGLDTSNSSFYLAAWAGDDPEAIRDRLSRISRTAQQLIDAVGLETA